MTPFIKRRNRRADEGLQDYSLADIAHLITIEAKNVEAMVGGLDDDRTGHVRMELSIMLSSLEAMARRACVLLHNGRRV